MTRDEYMNAGRGDRVASAAAHRVYYAQFVDEYTRRIVVQSIGIEWIKQSTDEHMNDIGLARWDALVCQLSGATAKLKAQGDYLTLGTGVCILKEAARQIKEGIE